MDNMAAEKNLFEDMPVPKAVLQLALPSVVGQIILVIYNMADTFFVGLTGSDAMISAVTVCMPAFMFLSAIANLFGVGGASVISRALGKNAPQCAKHTAAFSFAGCTAAALVYGLGAWALMDPFIDLLGGTDVYVHSLARSYMLCTVVAGGTATSLNALFAHLIRAEGHAMQASAGIALGGVLNIALDPLFMFVLLQPGQETLGAALATMLSNVAALLYFAVLCLYRRGKSVLSFWPSREMLRHNIPQDVLITGLPACLMTLFENVSYAVLDKLMSLQGTVFQAGIGVAKKVNMLAHCIVRGIAQGVLPLIGYNYSAKNFRRMTSAVKTTFIYSLIISVTGMVFLLTCAGPIVKAFIDDPLTVAYGQQFQRIICVTGPCISVTMIIITLFQSVGRKIQPLILSFLRKGSLDIPAMFLMNAWIGVNGIAWATPIADVIAMLAAVCMFIPFWKGVKSQL